MFDVRLLKCERRPTSKVGGAAALGSLEARPGTSRRAEPARNPPPPRRLRHGPRRRRVGFVVRHAKVQRTSGCETRPGSCRFAPVVTRTARRGNPPGRSSGQTSGFAEGATAWAVTRVNVEQASKVKTRRRASNERAKAVAGRVVTPLTEAPDPAAGVMTTARAEGSLCNVRGPTDRRRATGGERRGRRRIGPGVGRAHSTEGKAKPSKAEPSKAEPSRDAGNDR